MLTLAAVECKCIHSSAALKDPDIVQNVFVTQQAGIICLLDKNKTFEGVIETKQLMDWSKIIK